MVSAADLLDAMADYIDEHGWTTKQFEDKDSGAVCIIGAYHRVYPDGPWMPEVGQRVQTAIMGVTGGFPAAIYNDYRATSKAEVVDTLLQAAQLAKECGL